MHELLPKRLWIANAIEARDARMLFDLGIEAVVDVAYEEAPARLPRQLIYCRFPLNDGGGNPSSTLRLAVRIVTELVENAVPTAVACSAGMSRSPLIAAFAASQLVGESADDILKDLAQWRPLQLNAALWNEALAALSR
ncbi:MAG: dual specificity protein phosphatase [Planctomycetota bacterium]